jgi:hypothetical protein
LPILPGIYSAQIKVLDKRVISDGSTRTFEKFSNVTPFTVTPKVETLSAPDANNVVNITGFIFQHADLQPENVQVFVGETLLSVGTYDHLNRGQFAIKVDDDKKMQIRLPANLDSGTFVPFRLFVNGAESEPKWIKVP